jgi:methylglutaconyl-CoA hydratase
MQKKHCELAVDELGVARIRLNRTESHNALNPELLEMLSEILDRVDGDSGVRSVELSSTGEHFCSGMDLKWLQECFDCPEKSLEQELRRLGGVLHKLFHLGKPTIALVRGAAYGGGAGLVSCCDIALGSPSARFCFSEVRLGLIPSIISPFVIQAISERNARRYFLSGEVIDAGEARRTGLLHEVFAEPQLPEKALQLHRAFNRGAPHAIKRIKDLLTGGERLPPTPTTLQKTIGWLEETRNTDEAREGIAAFVEKRSPKWVR